MKAYGGDTTALFLDVASCLASARCWGLRVGEFETSLNVLEDLAR